ncbi:hypothetical protein AWH62_09690 [Maricaulis sp. W15]|uniref:hypothetical protein n=1 Tax=Maricaulis sp. W15 TaxID=1772333 RepID=UPI0009490B3D|nr:hypothetical protein [Maricaulis sp. W15]OLF73199.1 hypothetical protein AWH62_09690 [Maricaulis sp. W15]
MSKAVYRLSSIARPLEAKYPTNLAVLVALPLIGTGLGLYAYLSAGGGAVNALITGLEGMVIIFLGWALGREADPDRNLTAFMAAALILYGLVMGLPTSVWTLAFVLMAARTVNRTVGQPAKPGDLGIVLVLAGLSVFSDGYALMGLVAAIAIAIDVNLDRSRSLALIAALIALAFTVWQLITLEGDFTALLIPQGVSTTLMAVIGGLGVIGLLTALLCPVPTSVCDARGEALSHARVRGGRLVISLALLAGMAEGNALAHALYPLACVLLVTFIVRFIPTGRGAVKT